MKRALLILLAALAAAPAAVAGGPYLMVGAADDVVLLNSKVNTALAQGAGLDTVRITAQWKTGLTTLGAGDAAGIGSAVAAAKSSGVRVVISLYPFGSSVTPLTDQDRADFAAWAADVVHRFPYVHDWIVGNEPNLNRFWMPQFGPGGEDVAASAYEALLAQAYDAIKAAEPHSTVYGGALAPRGVDKPNTGRDTHSPTAFLLDLGAAYRASGRQVPIMDAFAFHPYADASNVPPSFAHPNSTAIGIADYDKLVSLLGQAFDGTAQRGSTLPILYDEFGVESQTPAAKEPLYTGVEAASVHPVDEATQAQFYRQALELTFCQKNVIGLLLFHFVDEPAHAAWQSGLYYVDGTPKTSLLPTKAAIDATHRGVVAQCPALTLTPKLTVSPAVTARGRVTVTLTSSLDARYSVTLQRVGSAPGKAAVGTALGRVPKLLRYRLRPGRYRWTATATALQNAGPPAAATTRTLVVR
ncbi:MAG TPA: hypothetical protein VLN26_12555 [Gaiellaceae bacterium]|nr:hypothetical protein [Gaiellaceae bacterium]